MKTKNYIVGLIVMVLLLITIISCAQETVQIGNQVWMKKNLNVGTMISTNQPQTFNNLIEKYCPNNDTTLCSEYGGLYQWNELMQYETIEGARGICPEGFHVPTNSDIIELMSYLGTPQMTNGNMSMSGESALKVKESGMLHWNYGYPSNNITGFSSVGAGYVYNGMYKEFKNHNIIATSTIASNGWPYVMQISKWVPWIWRYQQYVTTAVSVRCIKN